MHEVLLTPQFSLMKAFNLNSSTWVDLDKTPIPSTSNLCRVLFTLNMRLFDLRQTPTHSERWKRLKSRAKLVNTLGCLDTMNASKVFVIYMPPLTCSRQELTSTDLLLATVPTLRFVEQPWLYPLP